ncbi:unnamed protein product [Owenia fusiformis]|uniref:Chitobiosyldiphosphodolichol beta-mannosyltransferase n=1 Tax=Owenia fusiformis TaxID=6347 RepID=A0A8J1ULE0_OWEFU|nr:unnamed protein product [Owenia fusiformis]
MWFVLLFAFVLILLILVLITYCRSDVDSNKVCVVVLGDVGRSPRMQYHAISLANEDYLVDIIGYSGSKPPEELLNNENIMLHFMRPPPDIVQKLPKMLIYLSKVVWQATALLWLCSKTRRYKHIILQNPPSIPTMAVMLLVSYIQGSKLLIDWHNYGYTILAMAVGSKHPLVKIAKWYEHKLGKFSKHNICVTNAMREDLKSNWGISAETVYDRPPEKFKECDTSAKHELFIKLAESYPVFRHRSDSSTSTAFTEQLSDGSIRLLPTRPALLVSSTSWTDDEDFSVLLHALDSYETVAEDTGDLPKIICAITGKGPNKAYYKAIIEEKFWTHIQVVTPWLEAEDYPKLLGCADLGVCLHMSSSGLDLPMKVVDMFGCGLPVCAVHFNCLDELVQHDSNGLVFHNEQQLAEQLQDLLSNFPKQQQKLDKYRENLKTFQSKRWKECWQQTVLPLLKS